MRIKLFFPLIGLVSTVNAHNHHLEYSWAHSLYAPYISAEGRNNNWDFDALVSMYDFVQLTPEMPHKNGWAFTKEIFEKENWHVEFFFRISGKYPADGMAFWFVDKRYQPGNAFGYKENFKGLGIFFDVYKNQKSSSPHPWISAMIGDGVVKFDHHSDGQNQVMAGCQADILNTPHPVQAKITYVNKVLELQLKIEDGDWKTCFAKPGVHLPKRGYLGFTAHTGEYAARHELLAVTAAGVEPYPDRPFNFNQTIKKPNAFASFFVFVFAVGGISALGLYFYKEKKRHEF